MLPCKLCDWGKERWAESYLRGRNRSGIDKDICLAPTYFPGTLTQDQITLPSKGNWEQTNLVPFVVNMDIILIIVHFYRRCAKPLKRINLKQPKPWEAKLPLFINPGPILKCCKILSHRKGLSRPNNLHPHLRKKPSSSNSSENPSFQTVFMTAADVHLQTRRHQYEMPPELTATEKKADPPLSNGPWQIPRPPADSVPKIPKAAFNLLLLRVCGWEHIKNS